MDDPDWKLLDLQMRNSAPPPRAQASSVLILVAGFLAGIAAGTVLFEARETTQTATTDGKTALAFFFEGSRNAAR
jgi:hypothetical protein